MTSWWETERCERASSRTCSSCGFSGDTCQVGDVGSGGSRSPEGSWLCSVYSSYEEPLPERTWKSFRIFWDSGSGICGSCGWCIPWCLPGGSPGWLNKGSSPFFQQWALGAPGSTEPRTCHGRVTQGSLVSQHRASLPNAGPQGGQGLL